MTYTDEGVRAKLSALNETQESIVTVAQWIMFHRRYADRSAGVWLQKVKDSGASKRLNLVYLANEVVQQSKARKKNDFLIAFSPIIADATATAYRGATNEVQNKLRRVVEVWRQRQIFDTTILEAVEGRINEIDKSRSSGKKPLLGGLSPFASSEGSIPPELQQLAPLQTALNKVILAASSTVAASAGTEYDKLLAPDAVVPSPPVYAARLSGLLKTLASASGAVNESLKARRALIQELQRLLDANKENLSKEESQAAELEAKSTATDEKKRKIEDEILRGLPSDTASIGLDGSESRGQDTFEDDDGRPQMEALTPPPMESFTPPDQSPGGLDGGKQAPLPSYAPESAIGSLTTQEFSGAMMDGNLSKKRKLDVGQSEGMGGDAMADLDEDVAELLRSEGGGG